MPIAALRVGAAAGVRAAAALIVLTQCVTFGIPAAAQPGPAVLTVQKDVIPITQLTYGVNTTWAKTHGDLVVAFLNAHVQAVQWLYDPANKARAIDILIKETSAAAEDAAKIYDLYVTKAKFYTLNGTTSREKVRLALDTLIKTKHINTAPAALDIFYDNRYVTLVNTHLKIR